MQIFPVSEKRSRVVWIIDMLPNELAGRIGENMDKGIAAMKQTIERSAVDDLVHQRKPVG